MLKPAEKPTSQLIHHPSTVLDDLCAFDLANENWAEFDEKLSTQLAQWEQQNRAYFTPRAVRQSLGR